VDAADEMLGGRDYFAVWETALAASGLPIAETDAGRVRFAIGAPLPAGTAGRAELADLWLTERVAAWVVREALDPVLPPGHELVDLDDIWLGAPALAGRIAAADYLVVLRGLPDAGLIAVAADRLLAAESLVRERAKSGGVKTYDLRPLLVSIAVATHPGAAAGEERLAVRMRTRIHPELGSGRPEEVVAALADEARTPLETADTIRERLVLADDLEGRGAPNA
jgi:radical SAM-linked protein